MGGVLLITRLPFDCVDLKPEGFPLTQLREKEGEPWRKVMDLERVLCFSSAKINGIVFMGNMMVGYSLPTMRTLLQCWAL